MPKKHFNTHPNRQCEHPFAVDTRASSAGTAFGKIRKSSRIRQALNPSPLAPFGLSIERFMCFIRTHVPSRAVIQLVRSVRTVMLALCMSISSFTNSYSLHRAAIMVSDVMAGTMSPLKRPRSFFCERIHIQSTMAIQALPCGKKQFQMFQSPIGKSRSHLQGFAPLKNSTLYK